MLGYEYPLLGVFWTITIFALWFIVVFTVIWAFIDNFRRHDHSGWAKAGWALVIIILPLLGTLIYLVARPAVAEGAI
jgi:Phospholipase_D-nuclease N-terminal